MEHDTEVALIVCVWEDDGDSWFTSCRNRFTLIDGTPSQNHMKFCCYCGNPLHEVEHRSDELQQAGHTG